MKRLLAFLLLVFAGLHLLYSQTPAKPATVPVKDALKKITKVFGARFVYDRDEIQGKTTDVNLDNIKGQPLEDVLKAVLYPNDLVFLYIKTNYYTIVPRSRVGDAAGQGKPPVATAVAPSPPDGQALQAPAGGNKRNIRGQVTDAAGKGLAFVTIITKGSKTANAITDAAGNYIIDLPAGTTQLQFSSTGYEDEIVPVGTSDLMNVSMKVRISALTEVVVVGYGEQKKASVTGAVSSINSKEIKQAPVSNLSNSLAGLLPGLVAVNSSGRPGAGSSISIRGKSTFGNNNVLTVIDGIIRSFDEIDPNEVESVTVLKDAAAAAVYGARSANGVILITTRRGHTGKPRITLNSYIGVQQPTRYPRLMTASEYAETNNAARLNNNENPVNNPLFYTSQQLQDFKTGKIGTDWYDISFNKNALQQQHNISIDGGSDNIKYFFSGGYTGQEGMYNNIDYKRYNFRSNVDARVNKLLTVSVDLDGRIRQNNSPSFTDASIFAHVLREKPVFNAYNPDGTPKNTTGEHPVEEINHSGYVRDNDHILFGTINFKQALPFITKGLSASAKFNYNTENEFVKEWDLPYSMYDEDSAGNIINTKIVGKNLTKTELTETYYKGTAYTIDLSLNYQRSFGKHDLGALLLYEQAAATSDTASAYRTNFPSNQVDQLYAGGDLDKSNTGSAGQTGRLSYVGRVNYGYDNRYLFEASFRYDGSSIFLPGKRYGFFPAVSAGWRISEEKFIKDNSRLSFINNLKLRASYGVLGNDRVAPFQYTDAFSSLNSAVAIFNNTDIERTLIYGVYPNPDITWERAKTADVGMEGTLFNGKLGFELDYFYKRTSDILQPRTLSVPGTFGRTLPSVNYAVADNQGYEIVLSHTSHLHSFNYTVRANMAYAVNKGVVLDDGAGDPLYKRRVGKTLDYRTGLAVIGKFQSLAEVRSSPYQGTTTAPGDLKYLDRNGDGVVDDNDIGVISNDGALPKFTYGLYLAGDWKGLDVSVLFQGAARVNYMMTGTARNMFNNGGNSNSFAYLLDYWTPQNPNAEYPRAWIDANPNNNKDSDFWLRKTDYIRLKSVQLGYTVPGTRKWGIEKLRVYLSGFNLFTASRFSLFDPEVAASGGTYYPEQRNFNAGINLTF